MLHKDQIIGNEEGPLALAMRRSLMTSEPFQGHAGVKWKVKE